MSLLVMKLGSVWMILPTPATRGHGHGLTSNPAQCKRQKTGETCRTTEFLLTIDHEEGKGLLI